MASHRRGSATEAAVTADDHGEALATDTSEHADTINAIMGMVTVPPGEADLQTDDADLPILSWENTAEVKGGNLTDMGFAKLMPGFEFRGFIVGTKKVPSEFGKEEPVIDLETNKPVLDENRQPIKRKMQEVYILKGTARFPVKGATADTFGECKGRMTIPVYARLLEPVAENSAREAELTKKARAKSANAPAVHIPLHIKYVGQNPDKETAGADGALPVKSRSGAHLFTVVRLRVTEAAA